MRISRLFVANRGEIAVRVIRACKLLDIETVIGVSEADRDSLASRLADHQVCIGPAQAAKSYLDANRIIMSAKATKSEAIHPGYGFLSEDAKFARLCDENEIIFVGPTAENIRQMGNKLEARALAKSLSVPLIEGSAKIEQFSDASAIADYVGYPVLLKAAAGGGGRGIRIVREKKELRQAFESASAEAKAAFGDNSLFLERYIEHARHIEAQILADHYGNVVHLGERDCSMQRRYQKVIEEAPACNISDTLRQNILKAAVKLASNIGYRNAGTVEFIVDMDREEFSFLEMNTRLQVEHPVTELITGRDLVVEQLKIAGGDRLSFNQDQVNFSGSAIECRINAESAVHNFRPSPGKITNWIPPLGPGVRFDTHCYQGYTVTPHYDSLIGKMVYHGSDRGIAIKGMKSALEEFCVDGISTTVPLLKYVLEQADYINCSITTRWLENVVEQFVTSEHNSSAEV